MKNYIKIDGKKVEISEETANNFKKMLKLKTRAEKGDDYYYAHTRTMVDFHTEQNDKIDEELFEIGNYFLTKEDAEDEVKKLKEFWKSLK